MIAAMACTFQPAEAQTLAGGAVRISDVRLEKDGTQVNVGFSLATDGLELSSNRGTVLRPMLVNADDTLRLQAVEILGRRRWLYYEREHVAATENPLLVLRHRNGASDRAAYACRVPYEDWMDGSQLVISQESCGCGQVIVGDVLTSSTGSELISPDRPWDFQYAYVKPKAEPVKAREVSGSARLNFVVDKYDIRPDFGNNAFELRKIRQTIDLVKNDSDVTLTGIELHGYASPDGSYAHNEELAGHRTEALVKYLENYYPELDRKLFSAASTAEDWAGVREYVDTSSLDMKSDLLKIIDGDAAPDEKDRTIAARWPAFYRNTLIAEVYPFLRRTDYKVSYTVKDFSLEEARKVIKERPQNLSLNEMYLVAGTYEAGSEDFCHVFDVAVRMYPESEPANLNAACVALSRGDRTGASGFLARAGDSPEADNARAVLACMNGDLEAAEALLRPIANTLPAAKKNLLQVQERLRTDNNR